MHTIERTEGYRIVRDSSRESGAGFYARVGWLFTNKSIRKELGGPLDSNDDYIWLIVFKAATDDIMAFACLDTGRKIGELWFDNAYVFPDYRGEGLHTRLFELRMEIAKTLPNIHSLKGLARPTARMAFEANGFTPISGRGQYRTYEKKVNDGD